MYDLGAGTFDVSAVRRTATGYSVLASEELTGAGGLDLDEAIVKHVGTICASRDPSAWERLQTPRTAADLRHRLRLLADVQVVKEMVTVPDVPETVCLTTDVSLLISKTTGSSSPSDEALVRCKFYGSGSAALCLMYAAGTAWLESSGEIPWTIKIVIRS